MEEGKYLRVTDIIKRLTPKMPPDVEIMAKAKGEIGTRVHAMIDDYLQGNVMFYADGSREAAFFESFAMWYEQSRFEIIMKEARLYCDSLMITGQVDAVMSMHGMPVLVDYKTSSAEGKLADGGSSWDMQAHFYHYLLNRNFITISDKMIFLQLRECKEIYLIQEGVRALIKPSQLRDMLSGFSEDDRNTITEKCNTVGEFEYMVGLEKRKILVEYKPKIAKVFEYSFNENMSSRCIEEAKKAWKEITEK